MKEKSIMPNIDCERRDTRNELYESVIIAGFGGQGIILAGRLLAQAAMKAGKEVTFIPAYGAEVRGGTSNCTVIIADEPIACPIVASPDSLIAMSKASMKKFAATVKGGGLIIYNSSMITNIPDIDNSLDVLAVPVDRLELGSPRSSNMVAIGAYLGKKGILGIEQAAGSLADVLAERYHKTIPLNTEALRRGAEFAKAGK
jgi:2-oxoglutarate ferredoxin oxidoreductase subunit gamma